MKRTLRNIIFGILSLVVIIGIIILGSKLVGGAVSIVNGAFNTILGVAVIICLIIIVIWMFSYAKKKK